MNEVVERLRELVWEVIALARAKCWHTAAPLFRNAAELCEKLERMEGEGVVISSFRGDHDFLSNFFPAPVEMEGELYPSVEHAYQAAKCVHEADKKKIRLAPTAREAKGLGRRVTLRPDWELRKEAVMYDLLRMKFQDPTLRERLLLTLDQELVEGNTWGDTYWGVSHGKGQNRLGVLLMKVRREIKAAQCEALK